jgi:hypothetical protein
MEVAVCADTHRPVDKLSNSELFVMKLSSYGQPTNTKKREIIKIFKSQLNVTGAKFRYQTRGAEIVKVIILTA